MSIYNKYLGDDTKEATLAKLVALGELAKRLECSQPQLCLAWTLKSNDVTTCLLGASKASQLEDNIGALDVVEKLTPEILEEIEGILGNRPDLGMNPRTFGQFPPRR